MTREEKMVQAARHALGTPFHHQGRVSGIGLDCIGLVIHALRAASFVIEDTLDYGRQPEPRRLRDALLAHGFVEVPDIKIGDVLLLRVQGMPQHVALATGSASMIHAYAPIGRVVETALGETWRARIATIYRLSI